MGKINLGILPKLLLGILIGILVGSLGNLFNVSDAPAFRLVIEISATFTSLFSTFLQFLIPLLIVSFVAVGLADLGQKANKLFLVTLLLAYCSTVLAGLLAYFFGYAVLPQWISPISSMNTSGTEFSPLFTISVDPVFGVMTALILAFVLGIGLANIKGERLLGCLKDLQQIITLTLKKIIIPLIPVYIATQFAGIAASGELFSTIKMFIMLFVMILVFQWVYLLVQFGVASLLTRENQFRKIKILFRLILPRWGLSRQRQPFRLIWNVPIRIRSRRTWQISASLCVRPFIWPAIRSVWCLEPWALCWQAGCRRISAFTCRLS